MAGDSVENPSVSCGRCRRRKVRCDRQKPCSRCIKAGVECTFPGGGVRQRPVPRRQAEDLQEKVRSLELFIQTLREADDSERKQLLDLQSGTALAVAKTAKTTKTTKTPGRTASASSSNGSGFAAERIREGRLRKLSGRKATQFFGSTSLFQLQPPSPVVTPSLIPTAQSAPPPPPPPFQSRCCWSSTSTAAFHYDPHDDTCRQLMVAFFQNVYLYYFCVYREYFLRDYAATGGSRPYYSDMLMYCICAIGALISPESEKRALAPVFIDRAESLLLGSLHQPELTTLQSLLLLAQLEIGRGCASKGWLFCGMACRLTHEMGLHLDPTNWGDSRGDGSGGPVGPGVDREILRRVYWAAFIVDKQLSLFFGRPPALYPQEADVRNTIRIPYPPEWQSLLETYIARGASATAFEDGVLLIGAFVHQAELAKIVHDMIVDVFERRGGKTAEDSDGEARPPTETAPSPPVSPVAAIHNRLLGWLARLPQKLQSHAWTVGPVLPPVLHLHMLFHTAMIILHRPPWSVIHGTSKVCEKQKEQEEQTDSVEAPPASTSSSSSFLPSEDLEICYESLSAILRLLRNYTDRQHYRPALLPLDFVHTLSAAAGVVIIRRHLEHLPWSDSEVSKPLAQLLDAMRAVENVYPCITEIRTGIETMLEREQPASLSSVPAGFLHNPEPGIGAGSEVGVGVQLESLFAGALPYGSFEFPDDTADDLGFLVTDDFLNGSWDT